ncbi:low molecular weight protein-tyrosine-phosphatase [Ornithinimicrobium pratense]|uniref:protein-tyrosine-phosphatase n=1 Tax=Ornithinimicrobium pratense TaxID=2593973 RepID=A0A5J6V8I7_9MICO|nr:low molecular weight protein-tyrosine-phosphatase [Ornithinimicrobium pratense]QFG69383.1 low molecular weight phosphotyrosine protein phosphatase [Ornithinimicrobium pratense]
MRIMTVCLGNICRSPAAEAVLVHELRQAGLDHVSVTSAGTGPWHVGRRPHEMTIEEGEGRGYTLSTVGIQFLPELFDEADLVVAMDSANEQDILVLARTPQDAAKVVRLGAFAGDAVEGVRDVPDPYNGPREGYTRMYDQIEDAVAGLVRSLQQDSLEQVLAEHRSAR